MRKEINALEREYIQEIDKLLTQYEEDEITPLTKLQGKEREIAKHYASLAPFETTRDRKLGYNEEFYNHLLDISWDNVRETASKKAERNGGHFILRG